MIRPSKGSVTFEGKQIEKEAPQKIVANGLMINADSRKIHNAVVTDTINYNQHTFLRDADDNVIVEVYEAVLNNGTWEKGEKVTFTNEDNPKITSDVVAGTQSLVIAFLVPLLRFENQQLETFDSHQVVVWFRHRIPDHQRQSH